MDETVIVLLRRAIQEHKEELKDFVASGGAETMESYSRLVGRYETLKLIEGEMEEIEKRFEVED